MSNGKYVLLENIARTSFTCKINNLDKKISYQIDGSYKGEVLIEKLCGFF